MIGCVDLNSILYNLEYMRYNIELLRFAVLQYKGKPSDLHA